MPDYNQQRVGAPYGNVFFVQTPALDKAANLIYQDEQRREQQRLQQNQKLDDEFARNLSGVRDADIGDVTKTYGDYKLAYQQLMKKRGGGTPQEQLEVLRKKAAIYDVINKSKQDKEWEDLQAKQIANDKKGLYAKDAHDLLIQRRNTPISKLDRSKDNDLLYKYYVPDLAKELQTARKVPIGQDKKEIILGVDPNDPLKDKKEIYTIQSNPNDFYGNLISQLATSNKGENFAGFKINQYTDEELDNLKNRYYAKINDPKFKAIYGEVKDFPAMNTRLGQAAAIQTMEEFADLPLNAISKSEVNQDRLKKQQMDDWKTKNALTYGQSLTKIRLNASLQGKEPVKLGDYDVLGKTYGNKEVTEDIEFPVGNSGFKETQTVKLVPYSEVDVNDRELFKGVRPYNVNGKTFYKVRENGDWEGQNGQVISAEKVAKANFDRTTANEQVRGRTNFDNPKPKPQGKTMSAAEFRKLSITQRQQFLNSGGKVQ